MTQKFNKLDVIYNRHSLMLPEERLMLYALVVGIKPQHYLELGTAAGGSALIVCRAMDHNGFGDLTLVDEKTDQMPRYIWNTVKHRADHIEGVSPQVFASVVKPSGGFDFVLIDGDHREEHVRADVRAITPLLASPAYVLFHDAHYVGVQKVLQELGYGWWLPSVFVSTADQPDDTDPSVRWGGLALMTYCDPDVLRNKVNHANAI